MTPFTSIRFAADRSVIEATHPLDLLVPLLAKYPAAVALADDSLVDDWRADPHVLRIYRDRFGATAAVELEDPRSVALATVTTRSLAESVWWIETLAVNWSGERRQGITPPIRQT